MTRTATHVNGTRHHVISFEPWAGGPSAAITWNVPRKCLALCPTGVGFSGGSSGSAHAADASAASSNMRKAEGAKAAVAAAAQEEEAKKEDEEEEHHQVQKEGGEAEGESGVGVLSPLPSSMEVYPAGTAVVVRSVEADPGRTLKFARGETYEAAFQEILGREVRWNCRGSSGWVFHTRVSVSGQQDRNLMHC